LRHKAREDRRPGYVLTLARYVGAEDLEEDTVPFPECSAGLQATLQEQFAEAHR
jgi:type I restriction enzyme M protein